MDEEKKKKENELIRELEQAFNMIATLFRFAWLTPNSSLFDVIHAPFYSHQIDVHEEKKEKQIYIYVWLPNEISIEEIEIVPVNKKTLVLLSKKIGLLKKIELKNKIKPETIKISVKSRVLRIVADKSGILF